MTLFSYHSWQVGDKADELEADLVILSSEAIHSKYVDANQLAGESLQVISPMHELVAMFQR